MILVNHCWTPRAALSKLRVLEVAIGIAAVRHGAVPDRFSKIRERRTPRIRARAEEAGMTIKRRGPEFLHPDTVAQLQGLTDEEAAKQPPLIRERDGVFMRYWRVGRRVRCREVEASGVPASETGALHAAAEAEFGRSLPLLTAELPGGGVPDLDAIETTVRDGVPGGGAKRYAALLETVDARLAGSKSRPSCPSCGRRMERRGRVGKTFGTRLGEARVRRRYFYCRKCGVGDYPLDRALRLAGKRVTPGAEAVYADVAGSDSCGEARRKLWNLAGAAVSRATLQRHSVRIGEEMQAFEREDAEAASPAAERVLPGIDGTGVPMAAREVEGVAGKQADGTAKTREAKAVTSFTADGRDPKTGEPRKDKDSGAASVRIDSARAADGAGWSSEFGVRLRQFGLRNGLFAARELVVLSDGAPWIRNSCEEAFPGQETTFILDLFHALEYADAAVKAAQPDKSKQEDWMKTIKGQPDAGRVDDVIADLEPHRRLEAVATCIRCYGTNRDRMHYDLYRKRGLPVGSGVVESACKQIVGSRFKGAGRHWSKIGANAVLAIKCCFRNNRWPDFLDWRDCSAAVA